MTITPIPVRLLELPDTLRHQEGKVPLPRQNHPTKARSNTLRSPSRPRALLRSYPSQISSAWSPATSKKRCRERKRLSGMSTTTRSACTKRPLGRPGESMLEISTTASTGLRTPTRCLGLGRNAIITTAIAIKPTESIGRGASSAIDGARSPAFSHPSTGHPRLGSRGLWLEARLGLGMIGGRLRLLPFGTTRTIWRI